MASEPVTSANIRDILKETLGPAIDDALNAKLGPAIDRALDAKLGPAIDAALDVKLKRIEHHLHAIEDRLLPVESRLDSIESRLTNLEQENHRRGELVYQSCLFKFGKRERAFRHHQYLYNGVSAFPHAIEALPAYSP